MRIKIAFLFPISLGLINTACMSSLQLTKNFPAEIIIKDNKKTIQFVNAYDYTKLDFSNEKRINIYASGLNKIKEGLRSSFESNNEYVLFISDSVVRHTSFSRSPEPLPPNQVKKYCYWNSTSMLLVLEAFDIYYDKEIVEQEIVGETKREAQYFLVTRAFFTLYDSTGNIINRSDMLQDEFISSRDVIALDIAIRPSYENKKEEVEHMAYIIGSEFIYKFYPSIQKETRSYYVNKDFAEVTPFMIEGDWNKAIELLQPLANSSDSKLAKRAAHNLSLAYEALGDYELQEYWQKKSKK